jgi:hypothetical protein
MHILRCVLLLVLFLVFSGGQSIVMVNQAEAACCPSWRPGCVKWASMVYGRATLLASEQSLFSIEDDTGFRKEVTASQDVVDGFAKEIQPGENTKTYYGFSILKQNEDGKMMLIAFVPATYDHANAAHKPSHNMDMKTLIRNHNKLFEQDAHAPMRKAKSQLPIAQVKR